jgi:mercuric ion transport protein
MADKADKTDGTDSLLLRMGVIGTVIVALCCFTPVLVVLLGVVGLSALTGWLNVVLLPALGVFAGLTVYAVWRRQRRMKTT